MAKRKQSGNPARRKQSAQIAQSTVPAAEKPVARPFVGYALAVTALVGLFCSLQLLMSELKVLRDPNATLGCDLNPLIGCSDSLLAPQSHLLFGIPNSAIGMFLFGMLLALAAVLALKGRLPKLVWIGMAVGLLAGVGYIVYFLIQSITIFRALCPYCMGVWAAILAALPLVIGGAGASDALGAIGKKWGPVLLKYWWLATLILYLLVVLAVVLGLSDKIGMLFS